MAGAVAATLADRLPGLATGSPSPSVSDRPAEPASADQVTSVAGSERACPRCITRKGEATGQNRRRSRRISRRRTPATDTGEAAAERVDKQYTPAGRRRRGALKGLDAVTQTVFGDGRIGNDHHGLLRGVGPGLAPGQDGVGRIDGETVVALRPPLKEPVSGEMPEGAVRHPWG